MVYFLKDEQERVKIGYSKDFLTLYKRLTDLRVGNADILTLVALYEGTMEDEAIYHTWFHSIRGEWFEWEDEMLNMDNNLMLTEPTLKDKYNKPSLDDKVARHNFNKKNYRID